MPQKAGPMHRREFRTEGWYQPGWRELESYASAINPLTQRPRDRALPTRLLGTPSPGPGVWVLSLQAGISEVPA